MENIYLYFCTEKNSAYNHPQIEGVVEQQLQHLKCPET